MSRRVINAVGYRPIGPALDRSSARVSAIIDQAVRDIHAAIEALSLTLPVKDR